MSTESKPEGRKSPQAKPAPPVDTKPVEETAAKPAEITLVSPSSGQEIRTSSPTAIVRLRSQGWKNKQ